MIVVLKITSLLAFTCSSSAIIIKCGFAPGIQGPLGQKDIGGINGKKGDVGVAGLQGPQGSPGPSEAEPPYVGYFYVGARGPAGFPGRCGCIGFFKQQSDNAFKSGEYYYTDQKGNLIYMGEQYPEEYLQRKTTTSTTTTTTSTPTPYNNAVLAQRLNCFTTGLYILGPDVVLAPFNDAQIYDLFAKITDSATTTPSPTTTTTTSTSTTTPAPAKSDRIYIFGPRGNLIPLTALGIKKPFANGGHGIRFASSYINWLRGFLMGKLLPDYDEEEKASK